jgi:hypothetical protein
MKPIQLIKRYAFNKYFLFSFLTIIAAYLLEVNYSIEPTMYLIINDIKLQDLLGLIGTALLFILTFVLPTTAIDKILSRKTRLGKSAALLVTMSYSYTISFFSIFFSPIIYLSAVFIVLLCLLVNKGPDSGTHGNCFRRVHIILFVVAFCSLYAVSALRWTAEGTLFFSLSGDGRAYIRNAILQSNSLLIQSFPNPPYTWFTILLAPVILLGGNIMIYMFLICAYAGLILYVSLNDLLNKLSKAIITVTIATLMPLSMANLLMGALNGSFSKTSFFWNLEYYGILSKFFLIPFNLNFGTGEVSAIFALVALLTIFQKKLTKKEWALLVVPSIAMCALTHMPTFALMIPLFVALIKAKLELGRTAQFTLLGLLCLLGAVAFSSVPLQKSVASLIQPFLPNSATISIYPLLSSLAPVLLIILTWVSLSFLYGIKDRKVVKLIYLIPPALFVGVLLFTLTKTPFIFFTYIYLFFFVAIAVFTELVLKNEPARSISTFNIIYMIILTFFLMEPLFSRTSLWYFATTKVFERSEPFIQILLILNIAQILFYYKDSKIQNKFITKIPTKRVNMILLSIFFCTFLLYSSLWITAESSGTFMNVEARDLRLVNELTSSRYSAVAILLPLPNGTIGEHYLFASSFPLLIKNSNLSSSEAELPLYQQNSVRLLNISASKQEALIIYFGKMQELNATCFIKDGILYTDSKYVEFTKFSYVQIANGTTYLCTVVPPGQYYVQYSLYENNVMHVILGIVTTERP